LAGDTFLDQVPYEGVVASRGFHIRHRTFDFDFDVEGTSRMTTTERTRPMVSATLRDAISNVAASFRQRGRDSPFHTQNGVHTIAGSLFLHPKIRVVLLQGFGAVDDPPPNRQKAVTPALLKDMREIASNMTEGGRHTAILMIGGYFFAMRACEFCKTGRQGRTRRLMVENVTFRDEARGVVNHMEPNLEAKAMFVTICFVNQKNGRKMEKHSQIRTFEKRLRHLQSDRLGSYTGVRVPAKWGPFRGRVRKCHRATTANMPHLRRGKQIPRNWEQDRYDQAQPWLCPSKRGTLTGRS
jgi:hypothetical protein